MTNTFKKYINESFTKERLQMALTFSIVFTLIPIFIQYMDNTLKITIKYSLTVLIIWIAIFTLLVISRKILIDPMLKIQKEMQEKALKEQNNK